ncbi:hypothetical protein LTR50_004770 [Elasticomyces elasticus]|nr:hypothetical protein LTR50_004770 [Elasticomyces elasticus]
MHVDEELFANNEGAGDAASYLKETISKRFGVNNILDSLIYFPVDLMGLNCAILSYLSTALVGNALAALRSFSSRFLGGEQEKLDKAQHALENEDLHGHVGDGRPPTDEVDTFMSFDEYDRFREETSLLLSTA